MDRRTFLGALGCSCLVPVKAQTLLHSFNLDLLGANTAVSGYSLWESIDLLKRLGFRTIEVQNLLGTTERTPGEFPGFRFDRSSNSEKHRIQEALKGVPSITVHLPYTGLEYLAPSGPDADSSLRVLEMTMDAAAFLKAKLAVLHPKRSPGKSLEDSWELMIRRIRTWGDMAEERGFKLALETGFPQTVRDFVRLVQEVDHPNVGATLDVGHQRAYKELTLRVADDERGTERGRIAYNDINIQLVEQLGSKLIHLHVHDIEPSTWREHKPLVYGFIDYPRLIQKLREIRFSGALVFEIGGTTEEMPGFLAESKQKLEGVLGQDTP